MRGVALQRVLPLALAAVLVPSVAHAHLALRRSSPDSNATLTRSPGAITLWFTQRAQLAVTRIAVVGPTGNVPLAALVADSGNAVRAAIPGGLVPGIYTVRWTTASADGHPIRGEFRFGVTRAVDSARAPPTIATSDRAPDLHAHPGGSGQPQPLLGGARWLEFAAMVTILGVVGFHMLVLPSLASRGVVTDGAFHRARRAGELAAIAYLIAAGTRLVAQSRVMNDPGSGVALPVTDLVLATSWGRGWTLGLAGCALVLVAWRLGKARMPGTTALASLGAVGLAIAPALTGHAAAASPFVPSVAVDAAHVLGAGLWIGGLFVLLVAGVPALLRGADARPSGAAAVATLVNSFHPVALVCAPVVVVSGMVTSWWRLGSLGALTQTRYGAVLLVKLVVVLCVLVLGSHNSMRARRRLGTPDATPVFRVTAWSEVIAGAIVLVVTTLLVVTPPPGAE